MMACVWKEWRRFLWQSIEDSRWICMSLLLLYVYLILYYCSHGLSLLVRDFLLRLLFPFLSGGFSWSTFGRSIGFLGGVLLFGTSPRGGGGAERWFFWFRGVRGRCLVPFRVFGFLVAFPSEDFEVRLATCLLSYPMIAFTLCVLVDSSILMISSNNSLSALFLTFRCSLAVLIDSSSVLEMWNFREVSILIASMRSKYSWLGRMKAMRIRVFAGWRLLRRCMTACWESSS